MVVVVVVWRQQALQQEEQLREEGPRPPRNGADSPVARQHAGGRWVNVPQQFRNRHVVLVVWWMLPASSSSGGRGGGTAASGRGRGRGRGRGGSVGNTGLGTPNGERVVLHVTQGGGEDRHERRDLVEVTDGLIDLVMFVVGGEREREREREKDVNWMRLFIVMRQVSLLRCCFFRGG